MRFKEKTIITAIILSAIFFVAPRFVSAQIIINEIMYDLAGADDKHEWVELYNNGSSPVDLTDYKFNDGDTATNHGLNAPPKNNSRGSIILGVNEYLLLADDAATLIGDLPSYTGTIIDTVLNLLNTSATLKLSDKDGAEIAAAAYNKDLGGAGNGKTLEWDGAGLKESTTDGGTPGRTNSAGSITPTPSPSPTPTPSASNSPTPTPSNETVSSPSPTPAASNYQYSQKVFINEFLPWPKDDTKEWVELVNSDNATINLFGWQIDDSNSSTSPQAIPANTTIAPGEFLVISFNKNVLNNDGDKVRLLWPDDQVVHAVAYEKASQSQAVAKFDAGWLWTNQPTPGQTNKKSVVENTASAPSAKIASADKIIPKEESANAPTPITPNIKTPPILAVASPTAAPSINADADQAKPETTNINLLAAIDKPLATAKRNNVLVLAGILLLAASAAGGLIYFRRQKQVDIKKLDD